ncbi:uncharacterized protein [Onthophagus taurus]|uniref:uncharacterized protein n=1 Tax=Onthophagus taurus TaxID=166361 RepID=UPI000C20D647|nr:uncharacterized protein LOC111417089 [Onthophagus taurus]XP_022908592.1 uncharacterized protein LOC111419939 [Onthophagus taurus]
MGGQNSSIRNNETEINENANDSFNQDVNSTMTGIIGISNEIVDRLMVPNQKPGIGFNLLYNNYIVNKIKTYRKEREGIERELQEEYEKQEKIKDLNRAFVEGIMWVNNKRRLMDCYHKYPKHPMMCAEEVKAFTASIPIWIQDENVAMEI